jgi:AcrR family transcriptional regulator
MPGVQSTARARANGRKSVEIRNGDASHRCGRVPRTVAGCARLCWMRSARDRHELTGSGRCVIECILINAMPRPPKIKDEEILAAARSVFLEKGIRATTAEVARRAGIAEGSIFNRFPTKAALFQAAMRPTMEEPPWAQLLLDRAGKGDVRENLAEIGVQVLEFLRQIVPIMMMSWSNPSGDISLPEPLSGPNPPPLRAMRRLVAYFDAEIRAGRLRADDPELLARVFLGSLQNYVFFEVLLRAQDMMPLPATTYVRGVVQLLWNGAAPGPVTRS